MQTILKLEAVQIQVGSKWHGEASSFSSLITCHQPPKIGMEAVSNLRNKIQKLNTHLNHHGGASTGISRNF